jgi:hypothetical protein
MLSKQAVISNYLIRSAQYAKFILGSKAQVKAWFFWDSILAALYPLIGALKEKSIKNP